MEAAARSAVDQHKKGLRPKKLYYMCQFVMKAAGLVACDPSLTWALDFSLRHNSALSKVTFWKVKRIKTKYNHHRAKDFVWGETTRKHDFIFSLTYAPSRAERRKKVHVANLKFGIKALLLLIVVYVYLQPVQTSSFNCVYNVFYQSRPLHLSLWLFKLPYESTSFKSFAVKHSPWKLLFFSFFLLYA